MDIGKAFAFVFEDENWIVKILIAAAILLLGILFSWLLLIPLILALALLGGYSVEITRRVIRGELDGLPEWDDWGALLADGLKVMVIAIVYALPLIILAVCLGVPSGVLSDSGDAGAAVGGLLGLCLSCFAFLYAIAMSLALPAAIAFFAAEDELGAAFRFGDVYGLVRDNISTYLITWVMSWVANLIGEAGSLVCGIGWLLTFPYGLLVTGHLYGQAYVESTGHAAALAPADEEDLFEEVVVEEEVAEEATEEAAGGEAADEETA
jgi:hypothetical protein